MINYTLMPNTLAQKGAEPTGYHAQTVRSGSRTKADFVRMMVAGKGGSSEGEAALWLDIVVRTIILELSQGRSVNIAGFLNAGVSIKGSFPEYDSVFEPERNSLKPTVSFSRDIYRALEHAAVNRVSEASSGMFIGNVYDMGSAASDHTLTPGNVLKIFGAKIRLAGSSPADGVSFINAAGAAVKVPANGVSRNTAKELNVVVPHLEAGAYQVQVTTEFCGGKALLAAPRTFLYNTWLNVAA